MSLYNHVANKDQLLDGMVDRVFGEIDLPAGEIREGQQSIMNRVTITGLRKPPRFPSLTLRRRMQ